MKNIIEKLKTDFKKAAIVTLTSLILLTPKTNANHVQTGISTELRGVSFNTYKVTYPNFYQRYNNMNRRRIAIRPQYGIITTGTTLSVEPIIARGYRRENYRITKRGLRDCLIYEKQGENIVSKYLRNKKIYFKKNRLFKINNTTIEPDFLLTNSILKQFRNIKNKNIIIEYQSPEDEKIEKYSENKKQIYEIYKKLGGKVYFIGPKNTEDKISTEQELEKILEEISEENS